MHRRGTGHMFSETALDEFLRRNGLSHVIRAHEVKAAGFQVCFLQCAPLIKDTIFSRAF